MASEKLPFILVSPEKILRETEAEMVVIPGQDGDFGVMAGHAPLISALRAGSIAIFQDGKVIEWLFVSEGFAEVNPDGCTVLAERAENIDDFDLSTLETALKDLQDDLAASKDAHAQANIAKSIEIAKARITAKSHLVYA